MGKLKCLGKYILIFVVLIIIYFSLLWLTSLIPSDLIKENVTKSSVTLNNLGDLVKYNLGYKKEGLFLFTDALMINTEYFIDSNHVVESMLLNRKSDIPGQTTISDF